MGLWLGVHIRDWATQTRRGLGLVARLLALHDASTYFAIQSVTDYRWVAGGEAGPPMAWEVGMKKWLRRIRGAIGMGLTWAAAWGVAGTITMLGFLLVNGSRPDPPFPLMFGAFGFVAGVIFSGVLGLVEGRRRFDQMSLPRFAAWGATGGFLLSATFVLAVSLAGDPAFLWNLAVVGPVFAVAAAGSAAGSLALARRAQGRELLERSEDVTAVGLSKGEARKVLRNGP